MKKGLCTLLAFSLLSPALVSAHPGDWGRGPGWEHGPGRHYGDGGPGHLSFLPGAAAAVLIGGLTYYALNGHYYQRQEDNTYVVVQPEPVSGEMHALDYNGERFYVEEGHYYRRDIDGRYLEVPRPPGL